MSFRDKHGNPCGLPHEPADWQRCPICKLYKAIDQIRARLDAGGL